MSTDNDPIDNAAIISTLKTRIDELETALKTAQLKESIAYDILKELNVKHNNALANVHQQHQHLQKRINELENPESRNTNKLSWLGKVIFILKRTGRPLRATELFDEICLMDHELSLKSNPAVFLSVVLHKGVKEKRLSLHKILGIRGGFYALQEWHDDEGKLESYMIEQLY
jgi:hypothetical protein